MAINYEWQFVQFDTKPSFDGLNDVVSVIHWRLTGTDETGTSASNYGTVALGDPAPGDFVPYQDITKEMTISWMEATTDVDAIKASIAWQINEIKNPPVVPMVPPFDSQTAGSP